MDFKSKIEILASGSREKYDLTINVGGIKNAFVLPFIKNLGYDYTDPNKVMTDPYTKKRIND